MYTYYDREIKAVGNSKDGKIDTLYNYYLSRTEFYSIPTGLMLFRDSYLEPWYVLSLDQLKKSKLIYLK